ncbi:Dug2 [Kluyveromyces lactis]|nr:Dug2 [Kluyveromyces lactis]
MPPSQLHKWSHDFCILSTVTFPRKKLLFAGTQDSKILCIDLRTYNLIHTIRLGASDGTNTRSSVLCLTKSKNEEYLFSGGADSLVRAWSVGGNTHNYSLAVKEMVTIYSLMDIGDIFSLAYIDELDLVVFGSQNASLLYVANVFKQNNLKKDYTMLPHLRFDKFFDSKGPQQQSTQRLADSFETLPSAISSLSLHDEESACQTLQVPSSNILPFAHNGFVYSIVKLESHRDTLPIYLDLKPDVQYIISGGGDGVSKLWSLHVDPADDQSVKICLVTELDNDEPVLTQFVEFPFLYVGLTDGLLKIWDLNTNQSVSTLQSDDTSDITSLAVCQDQIFASQREGVTKFSQDAVYHWQGHQGSILSSEIICKSCTKNPYTRLVTGGNDGSLILWNITDLINNGQEDIDPIFHSHDSTAKDRHNSWTATNLDNDHMLHNLSTLIHFQTVSRKADTRQLLEGRRCATHLQQLFYKLGARNCDLIPVHNGGNPIIYSAFSGNSKNVEKRKKIVWYGHYDVVAADMDYWNTDPFKLTCENGFLKGRGVSDNKGPLLAAMYSVAELVQNGGLDHDITFIIEGQEENGSAGFKEALADNRYRFGEKIDWVILSNSYWLDDNIPCLNYGLRGMVNLTVSVTSDEPNRHSGFDGGVHREPTADLISIISKLQDDGGKILIPHYDDNIKPLSEKELAQLIEIVERAQLHESVTVDSLIAKWTKPSLSVTTMKVSGPCEPTVIPQSASVDISIRLVPGQDLNVIKKSLNDYLHSCFSRLKTKNHLSIKVLNEAETWLGNPSNSAYQIIREEIAKEWNTEPLMVREGGSIPSIRYLEKTLGAPVVQIPCGQSNDKAHLPNEQLRMKNWYKMREILTRVFNRL